MRGRRSPRQGEPRQGEPRQREPRRSEPRRSEHGDAFDAGLGVAVLDTTGHFVFVNDNLALRFGLEPADLIGQDICRFLDDQQRPVARQALCPADGVDRVADATWTVNGSDNSHFDVTLSSRPVPGVDGKDLHVVTAYPVLSLHGSVRRQALLASIAQDCDEAIISTGPGDLVEIWNHAAEELFGWTEKEVLGTSAGILVPYERRAEAAQLMERALAGEVLSRVETVRACRQGARVEVSISLAPVRDSWGQVTGVSQLIRDITQQKASERALAYQAMHDHLTGLPNRTLLEDRMAHALERCRREGGSLGVMFFDLDHFKAVNDTAGHEVGDELLRAVASRLSRQVRSMDTVARLGGDEFVVLCEDIVDDAHLDVIVCHIIGSFSEPLVLPDREMWVSVSAGLVRGGPSSTVAQLLSHADAAMYGAKDRARGSVGYYDPKTRPNLERKAEGSRLLRLALEADRLVPYYQPIVDLHSGAVVAAEALVRWEDPVRGLVSAKDFIPLAEELGLASEISNIVLAAAARQAKMWAQLTPGLKVAVNISPLQLRGTGLLTSVLALLDEGVKPSSLILEVTESALMQDGVATGSVLGELREAGFGIAIDDFGTGYSSLAYLKRLPATAIKVDKTFISQLPDPHDLSVVMAILAIADTYGLDVIAEGIETTEQAEVLRSLGCQLGQGFHFADALPAGEFTHRLERAELTPDFFVPQPGSELARRG